MYNPGTFSPGAHRIVARAFANRDGTGPLGFPLTINLIVMNS